MALEGDARAGRSDTRSLTVPSSFMRVTAATVSALLAVPTSSTFGSSAGSSSPTGQHRSHSSSRVAAAGIMRSFSARTAGLTYGAVTASLRVIVFSCAPAHWTIPPQ
jgi:hypothetical protein